MKTIQFSKALYLDYCFIRLGFWVCNICGKQSSDHNHMNSKYLQFSEETGQKNKCVKDIKLFVKFSE